MHIMQSMATTTTFKLQEVVLSPAHARPGRGFLHGNAVWMVLPEQHELIA